MKLWQGVSLALMLATMLTVTPVAAAGDPSAVIDRLEAALMAKDVDSAVALFTDDATARRNPPLPNTTGMYRGKAEIRTFWQALIALNPRFETVGQRQVAGEQVTWTNDTGLDVFRRAGIASFISRGEATVRGGKIVAITITIPPEELARLQAAMAAQPAVPPTTPRTGGGNEATYIRRLGDG